mmetsp:Transcript_7893/g.16946  ORF Transcript_7893/g.16946 Transcript_7893/m.16946 type:complete len:200 (+) Transcript_7893:933-1532(+)
MEGQEGQDVPGLDLCHGRSGRLVRPDRTRALRRPRGNGRLGPQRGVARGLHRRRPVPDPTPAGRALQHAHDRKGAFAGSLSDRILLAPEGSHRKGKRGNRHRARRVLGGASFRPGIQNRDPNTADRGGRSHQNQRKPGQFSHLPEDLRRNPAPDPKAARDRGGLHRLSFRTRLSGCHVLPHVWGLSGPATKGGRTKLTL